MKKQLTLKLIESNDTPQLGDIIRETINCHTYTRILREAFGIALAHKDAVVIKPILISDEEIKLNDFAYDTIQNQIQQVDKDWINAFGDSIDYQGWKKIEVTSEQIPTNILEAIVEGKLQNDSIVEVEYICSCESDIEAYDSCGYNCRFYKLKLDSNNKAICSIPEESTYVGYLEGYDYDEEVSKIMYSEEEVIELLEETYDKVISGITAEKGLFIHIDKQELISWFECTKKK